MCKVAGSDGFVAEETNAMQKEEGLSAYGMAVMLERRARSVSLLGGMAVLGGVEWLRKTGS